MATVRDMITSALMNIGVVAIEETPTAAEMADSFKVLNNMLASWANENLMVYNINVEVFPIISGQGAYTMGTGGDFNTSRPVQIEEAYMRDSNGTDYKIEIVDYETYSRIITKGVQSSLSTVMYDNNDFPLKTLTFWPIPNNPSFSFVLWSWKQIANFATIDDVLVLPPGYQRAIEFNLSMEISPRYGRPISSDLGALATTAKAQLKRINYDIKQLTFDPTLTRRGRVFNWLTGV